MSYEIFEGKGSLRKPRRKNDLEFFDYAKKSLGFNDDVDLVSFCAAIAINRRVSGNKVKLVKKPSLKQMVKMQSFHKAKLYDFILMNSFDIKTSRLEEFERHFYAGFKILKNWFDDSGPDTTSEIERFCELFNYLEVDDQI